MDDLFAEDQARKLHNMLQKFPKEERPTQRRRWFQSKDFTAEQIVLILDEIEKIENRTE